ncbi:DinB family protein [Fictibacillus barbaricus]|uniref:DinB family protein n=1 Tax=Fictibacillus barbaricus TaxID=182136 RepID=A0ABS2Z8C9_9BACL|nr:DinB family protein [Fictibacillus barbaricus]MBN3543871.1 DinB family protein [Fictibacillus barbaricus]GGB72108.1 DNA damage-inducible protein DinB [Fictibacillus barbaricus]
MDVFAKQYDWIKRTRESLFNYCETLSTLDYIKEREAFGGDSIRNLHAHVANCYRVWLGNRALGKTLPEINSEYINNVKEMREVFRKTDILVNEFLNEFEGKWDKTIQVTFARGGRNTFTTLWLFTHTATHEFHHKGQIVKIGRQLGYIPPDTDLIEP